MITDRISLNLALLHLEQIEANTGKVTDIEFTKKIQDATITKGISRFKNLKEIKKFVKYNTPIVNFNKLNTYTLGIYELKAFNIVKGNSTKNMIFNQNAFFKTNSVDINKINLSILNNPYIVTYKKIKKELAKVKFNEYIINQPTYIDNGYIFTSTEQDNTQLKQLFIKYKRV